MSGIIALSVNPEEYEGVFTQDLFWLTFYLQHWAEAYGGLSTFNQNRAEKIITRTHRGLFRPNFKNDLNGIEGTEGIGFCGLDREPFFTDSRLGKLSACFSGNIINLPDLVQRFKDFGHTFERGDDIEIIIKLLAQKENILEGIKRLAEEIKGAYSVAMLTKEGIYFTCCPNAHWPVVIGQKKGAIVVSSESNGFTNRGFKLVRTLEPGEIILMKNGTYDIKGKVTGGKVQFCSFIWVYTSFANSVFNGIAASAVRKRLGAALAKRDIEKGFIPDVVVPVPDSGRFHSIGYHQEFCRQMNEGKINKIPFYDEALLKYPYAGRSFTPSTEKARELEANIKILESGEDYYRGKEIVVNDDSLVRGVQTRANLVPKLKRLGMKAIHLRISNPELRSHCPWGKTTKRGETLVSLFPSKESRIKSLNVDSLEYNKIEDLVEAIGLSKDVLCVDCDLD